ncbi:MAG: hypothetical protein ACLUOF_06625 [Ruminococcus sp.]
MKDNGADYTKARAARGRSAVWARWRRLAAGVRLKGRSDKTGDYLKHAESFRRRTRPERRRLQQQRCQRILPFVPLL